MLTHCYISMRSLAFIMYYIHILLLFLFSLFCNPHMYVLYLTLYNVVLTPADEENHIDKTVFKVPFVCGARNLGEALRRVAEGASMIRTKGEAGTGPPHLALYSTTHTIHS